jgi:hypothetical protein
MKDLGLVVVEGVETSDEALRQREEPIPVELPVRVVGQNLHAGTAQWRVSDLAPREESAMGTAR